MDTNLIVGLILLGAISLYLVLRLSMVLARRAICTVVNTFRVYNAVRPENALSVQELGLGMRYFTVLRDYRPWALQTLVQANVIRAAEKGGYYLSESTLALSELETGCKPPGLETLLR